jgi:hypothetical protein
VVVVAAGACSVVVSTSGLSGVDGDAGADAALIGSDGAAGLDGGASDPQAAARSEAYRAAVLADQPLAYWRLGEPKDAALVNDTVSGGGKGEVLNGTKLGMPGVFGQGGDTAAELDGRSAGVLFSDVFDFAGNASYTLEAWIHPTVVDDGYRRIVDKQQSNTAGYRFIVRAPSGSTPGISCGRCKEAGGCEDVRSDALEFGRFVHVVCVYDGSAITLYVDGAMAKTQSLPMPILASTAPVRIGNQKSTGEGFVGALDEVAVYDKVLSTQQVSAHYRAARP